MTQSPNHLSHQDIGAFIDGELSADHAHHVEQHLATCPQCALSVVSAMQLKAATARACRDSAVPRETLSRLTAQVREETTRKPARAVPFARWAWSVLAACLIVGLSWLGWWWTHRPSDLTAELLDQHLAVLSNGASPEVISSDRHTVKPWFEGKLPFSFNLPETWPSGTVLKGGDLTFVHGQPAALLVFTVGKHQASVFLTQHPLQPLGAASSATKSGFAIQYANAQELHITAVSDVNPSDLAHLVSALADAQPAH